MSTATIDYDALAQQHGGSAQINYDALATQHGGSLANPQVQPTASISAGNGFSWRDLVKHPLNALDALGQMQQTPRDASAAEMAVTDAANLGAGALSVVRHPVNTVMGMLEQGLGARPIVETVANALTEPIAHRQLYNTQLLPQNPDQAMYAAGQALPFAIAGAAGEKAAPVGANFAGSGADMLRSWRDVAAGNPDAAALKAMNIPAKSKAVQRYISAAQDVRPYLQGVRNLQDLQQRLIQAKAEVWQPYQEAVDALTNKPVQGPDGPTTVGQLELDRKQLSAINRQLKSGDPAALRLAEQKGMTQADYLAKEKAVQAALDPELATTGIDPKTTRRVFGQLGTVQGRFTGRSTIAEPTQPSGLGRAVNVDLTRPASFVKEGALAARDIAGGKPLLYGKTTDVNIVNAFRNAGPKPNLGQFRLPDQTYYTAPEEELEPAQ